MNTAIWQKVDLFARSVVPFIMSLLLVILSVVPTYIPDYNQVTPVFALIAIYHWPVYRPNLLSLLPVFFLGFIQDLLLGTPIGLYILVFLTVYGIVFFQRRFFIGRPFIIYWIGFAVIAALASIESYLLASAWHLTLLNFDIIAFQYCLLLGLFPIITWIFLRWQLAFLQ